MLYKNNLLCNDARVFISKFYKRCLYIVVSEHNSIVSEAGVRYTAGHCNDENFNKLELQKSKWHLSF